MPPAPTPPPVSPRPAPGRRRLLAEVLIVLGLSLGASATYAVVAIVARVTAPTPLGEQTVAMNPSRSPRPWLDLTYQLLEIGFALVPVALALFLLSEPGRRGAARIGLDLRDPLRTVGAGVALAAVIGVPGLGLYLLGRALGVTVEVQAATLAEHWWTVPVLVLAAVQNSLLEEVVVAGYLVERLEQLGLGPRATVATSAVVRAMYHLYQGFGPFLGNLVMGLVYGEYYRRRRRTMPLVIAHALIDVVAFVGYALLPVSVLRVLGV